MEWKLIDSMANILLLAARDFCAERHMAVYLYYYDYASGNSDMGSVNFHLILTPFSAIIEGAQ